jgi:hypothetical protein
MLTPCSTSSAKSTASAAPTARPHASSKVRPSSPISRSRYAPNAQNRPATTMSPRPWPYSQALGSLHALPRRRTVFITNNAAERALRGIALCRAAWLFAGSDRGQRAAAMYPLIVTCKLSDVDPRSRWPTCWPESPAIRFESSTICCPGWWARSVVSWRHDRHINRAPQNHPG